MKRILLAVIIGVIISNVGFAAPAVDVKKDQVSLDYTYAISKNEEVYNASWGHETRKVNGHFSTYSLTYGVDNGTALAVSLGNLNSNTYTDQNGSSTPKVDIADIQVQKRVVNGLAVFTGWKRTTGSWTYSSLQGTVTKDNNPRNELELGIVGQLPLGQAKSLYLRAGFGSYFSEYDVGVTYQYSKNLRLDMGYNYLQLRQIGNPLFLPMSNNLDVTAKGFSLGLRYDF
jgi:opacity protein-like surface antigen